MMLIMEVNIEKIKRELKYRGWGIAQLAKESELSRQVLYDIMKSKTCTLKTISSIAIALDYDPKDLLK